MVGVLCCRSSPSTGPQQPPRPHLIPLEVPVKMSWLPLTVLVRPARLLPQPNRRAGWSKHGLPQGAEHWAGLHALSRLRGCREGDGGGRRAGDDEAGQHDTAAGGREPDGQLRRDALYREGGGGSEGRGRKNPGRLQAAGRGGGTSFASSRTCRLGCDISCRPAAGLAAASSLSRIAGPRHSHHAEARLAGVRRSSPGSCAWRAIVPSLTGAWPARKSPGREGGREGRRRPQQADTTRSAPGIRGVAERGLDCPAGGSPCRLWCCLERWCRCKSLRYSESRPGPEDTQRQVSGKG